MKKILITLAIGMALVATQSAFAATVDLTLNNSTGTGTLNGGIYQRTGFQPAGSGYIDSFVRVGAANQDFVQGYNTSARPLQFDENSSPTFTRDLTLGSIGTVVGDGLNGTTAGIQYKEFILDINQTGSDPLLTLNRVIISLGAQHTAPLDGAPNPGSRVGGGTSLFPGPDTIVYDSGQQNKIQLDYSLGAGSGIGDMSLLIPVSAFAGFTDSAFVTLYSEFGSLAGDTHCAATEPSGNPALDLSGCYANNNDGYEEWAIRTASPTASSPEPTSLVLLGFALVGIGVAKRRFSN